MDSSAKFRYSVFVIVVGLLVLMFIDSKRQSRNSSEIHFPATKNATSHVAVVSSGSDTIGDKERWSIYGEKPIR